MFDTTKIGKIIKNARSRKNMTQVDLADAMGISYQAVSNWERGNSMPDISKIPELCEILGISMDELMGNDAPTQTVKKIISDEEASISLEELASVAPIVPPQKMEKVFEENKGNEDTIDIEALIALAPFLDDEYLDELAEKISMNDLSQLTELAPFLSDETLTKIALHYEGPVDDLVELAPFLEEEALDALVEKQLAKGNCNVEKLIGLCPFLDEQTVRKIADYCMRSKNYSVLSGIAPFM